MPPPAKRVKATTYRRRDCPEVAKLCLRLIAETDATHVPLAIAILLVELCSGQINRQTDKQTNKQTNKQTKNKQTDSGSEWVISLQVRKVYWTYTTRPGENSFGEILCHL